MHKHREGNRVVAVEQRQVFGTPDDLADAMGISAVSRRVNMSFVERQNATDRGRDARKSRRTYWFSEDWPVHEAMTYLTMYGPNFCWCVRPQRIKGEDGRWCGRTPAMSAGLTDHMWSWRDWFMRPAAQSA